MTIAALIPARVGSKRIASKNVKPLAGHPLIAYTLTAAKASGVFAEIVVCTDEPDWSVLATDYGATGIVLRKPVPDNQADIEWVTHALQGWEWDAFAILRPTSPFRTAATIRRAYQQFVATGTRMDSLRAVEPVKQTPYKMWHVTPDAMVPLLGGNRPDSTPYHSCPTQFVPPIWVQNASLEMSWTRNVTERYSISGLRVAPFLTRGYEGFDLNTPADWREAEYLIASGAAKLPEVHVAA